MTETIAFVFGAALAVAAWLSVLRTVFVPRWRSSVLMRTVVGGTWRAGSVLAHRLPRAAGERVLELCAPLALYLAAACWFVATLAGFALTAPVLAGVPLTWSGLTGFLVLRDGNLLAVAAWVSALLVLASFVLHLHRVTAAYSRRELVVARMSMRAAMATEAEQVLAEHLRLGSRDHLDRLFAQWTGWLADILATHTGYPALTVYRPATGTCWLDAAVLVLDAAALTESVAPDWAPPSTRSVLMAGAECFPVLARQVGVRLPRPVVSLEGREERDFDQTLKVAVDAGLPQELGEQEAWPVFQHWRTRYAPYAVAMSQRLCYRADDPSAWLNS
ncbi:MULTISPECIES: hypothetical protein [Amycolatopsis]|uniref:Uncharacterized protein n=1 Tax=Amycolatopsis dendrobii TaxID=2760662 RepID=A0A7W3VZQ4_9PSEU|nr:MULTISPECIES: hypothetical protein [Amycolatopsis]MBB1156110.1 hypothetical protein [Amycolatopsis dendrobii]UKD58636.1 hypothetical protein L3Q65_18545 [Amycolatopsis sp. FU40]